METKLFEVRDRMTFIPCIAIRIDAGRMKDGAELFLARRAGYGEMPCVLFGRLDGGDFKYDSYEWSHQQRTMRGAHSFIEGNWFALESGDVVDVEYALQETTKPKTSERFFEPGGGC